MLAQYVNVRTGALERVYRFGKFLPRSQGYSQRDPRLADLLGIKDGESVMPASPRWGLYLSTTELSVMFNLSTAIRILGLRCTRWPYNQTDINSLTNLAGTLQ
jgi:hypothetical protein